MKGHTPNVTSRAEEGAEPRASARVRWVGEPSHVPEVRRFVSHLVADWGRADLVDDVALAATELAANAILHGNSPYFEVELRMSADVVHLAVLHPVTLSAQAIAVRAEVAGSTRAHDPRSMTGRGLFLVASLALDWGIDDLPGGVRTWAEFAPGPMTSPGPPRVSGGGEAPAGHTDAGVIRLLGCPPGLLLAHDANLADIAREPRLFGAGHRNDEAAQAAAQVAEIVRLSAVSWDAARLVAQRAVADGRREVDVATAPTNLADVPRKIRVLRDAVATAEALMAQGLLMTEPATPEVRVWRDWVESEMVEQANLGRDPVRFSESPAVRDRTRGVTRTGR